MQKIGINIEGLRKILPYGAIKEVAKRSNTSIYTVSRVLNGGSNNVDVINKLKEYVSEMKNTKEEINNTVQSLNTCFND